MLFPELARFTDVAVLLLRVMVGVVFVTSGWNHLREPEARSKDIEQSKGVTIFLGAAEVAAGLGLPVGSIGPTRARCLQRLREEVAGITGGASSSN